MKITNNLKIIIVAIIGLLFSFNLTNVNAASVPTSVKMKATSSLYYFTEKKKTDYINGYNFYRKELTDGTLAYCSDGIKQHVPGGKTLYLKGEVTDKGLAYIIKNGYPSKNITGNALKDYYITQAAIWRYFDETKGTKNWSKSTFTASSTGMKKHVYNLVVNAKLARNATNTSSISTSVDSNEMSIVGNEFKSNEISVSLVNTVSTYTVSLLEEVEGTKIMGTDGTLKTTFNSGEKFVVTTPINNITGTIKLRITSTGIDKKLYEYTTKNSYYQNIILVTQFDTEVGEVSTNLELNFNLNTKVKISKQDITNGSELPGATLVIKDANGNEVASWVSTNEVHYIENLLPGDYTLTEEIAPKGYKLSTETINFTVNTDGSVTSVVMYNDPYITRVQISKQDMANGEEVEGATLIIRDSEGKEVTRWVSSDKPHYIEGLPEGKYTLTEEIAPKGYKLSSETIEFELLADGTVKSVTMLNEREVTKVKISKQDMANGEEVEGATLIIRDESGKEVTRWVSSDKPHYIEGLPEGKYTLTEEIAPKGYKLSSETIEFELLADGTVKSVTMLNEREITKVKISKKDITNNEELPGATLIIRDSEGSEVARWVSSDKPHYIEGLPEGSYTLEEIQAPNGYKLTSEKISFRLTRDGNVQEVVMYNEKEITRVRISKQDLNTMKELSGATLVIKDESGKEVSRFVSESTPKYIEGLPEGSYTLSEIQAPTGYKLTNEKIEFTLKRDGKVNLVTIYNELEVTRVNINKLDKETNKNLSGAKLVIKNSNGDIVDSWISEDKPHYIEGLPEGSYTLSEIQAPTGYKLTNEKIEFTLKRDGTTENVIMYNEKEITKVKISKQDITSGEELAGATLVIKDANGNEVASWVSSDKPHYIEGLPEGNYTLTETIAPDGYELSSETVKFTLKADGTIQSVVMYNTKITIITKVKISKQDITSGEELPGATLIIRDSEGNEVARWVSTNEPKYIEGLEAGDYTLSEITSPDGYRLSTETINFTIKEDGSLTSVIMYNTRKVVKLSVSKQDLTTKKELVGAFLAIKNSKGDIVDKWISSNEPHYTENLIEGEYTLIELNAPSGYKLNLNPVKFTLKDSDQVQKVVIYNEKKEVTKVRISKQDITNKTELPGATLIVRDSEGNEVARWISTNTPHYIEGLSVGDYTLTELIAPNGYILSSETIKFSIKDDGSITDVVMYNQLKPVTKVLISKLDADTKTNLQGATLVIRDSKGNIIDKWVSGTNSHYIEGIDAGEYTLTELIAPDGYALNKETIKFNVTSDGSITNVVMYNSKLIIIPITDLNISTSTMIIGSLITFIGASILIFYKKYYI